ncbi:DUF3299 domain-containing protein [Vibrio sp. 10N.261.51.F12]|uniref:DUF3299 domain-containing protein n=1 Tax=Vibrio sp. 10N.261.51.F12 TaxID=3229679 RepID=UPI00354E4D0A
MKILLKLLVAIALMPLTANANETLSWDQLIPQADLSFTRSVMNKRVQHDGQELAPQMLDEALLRTVDELDGKQVKLPGYLVPIEGDDESITAFLLVPYSGACVHVPPPPPNQIVYVEPDKPLPMQWYNDPIWIVGTMETHVVESEMAQTGYKMNNAKILSFDNGQRLK